MSTNDQTSLTIGHLSCQDFRSFSKIDSHDVTRMIESANELYDKFYREILVAITFVKDGQAVCTFKTDRRKQCVLLVYDLDRGELQMLYRTEDLDRLQVSAIEDLSRVFYVDGTEVRLYTSEDRSQFIAEYTEIDSIDRALNIVKNVHFVTLHDYSVQELNSLSESIRVEHFARSHFTWPNTTDLLVSYLDELEFVVDADSEFFSFLKTDAEKVEKALKMISRLMKKSKRRVNLYLNGTKVSKIEHEKCKDFLGIEIDFHISDTFKIVVISDVRTCDNTISSTDETNDLLVETSYLSMHDLIRRRKVTLDDVKTIKQATEFVDSAIETIVQLENF